VSPNAGGLEIGLSALGGRARIAGIQLAGRGLDDVAEQMIIIGVALNGST
jgi:hypothetical protein